MSEPTRIYAVTTGSYSDYRVRSLFTSKKLAKTAAEATGKEDDSWYSDAEVEEFYLYDHVPEPVTEFYYQAELWDDGRVTNEHQRSETRLPWTHLWGVPPKRPDVRYVRAPMYKGKAGRLEVRGSNEQAVKQSFSDNKARILAEKAGI
jgi:hypothetical protein